MLWFLWHVDVIAGQCSWHVDVTVRQCSWHVDVTARQCSWHVDITARQCSWHVDITVRQCSWHVVDTSGGQGELSPAYQGHFREGCPQCRDASVLWPGAGCWRCSPAGGASVPSHHAQHTTVQLGQVRVRQVSPVTIQPPYLSVTIKPPYLPVTSHLATMSTCHLATIPVTSLPATMSTCYLSTISTCHLSSYPLVTWILAIVSTCHMSSSHHIYLSPVI